MPDIARLRRRYKIWFILFLLLNAIVLFCAVIANPYRVTPIQFTIVGINDIKPKLYPLQRHVKLFDIAYQKPKTILLGSSRVLWSIDPKNPLLQKYPPVYNAGILGPPMYEINYYFEHALANQPYLKRVFLGLDFYAFNSKFDNRSFELQPVFGKGWKDILKIRKDMVFDIGASIETIWASVIRKQVISLRDDGRLTPDPLSAKNLYSDFFQPLDKLTIDKLTIVQSNKKQMRDALYIPFHMSKQSFDALRNIIETCKQRNIELYIFISPTYDNSEQLALHQYRLWDEFEAFERSLARLHPFWDFVSWNSVTMNPYNYIDTSHHIFSVGDMMLSRMLGGTETVIPATFGRYVTDKTIETHLKVLDQEFNSILKEHGYYYASNNGIQKRPGKISSNTLAERGVFARRQSSVHTKPDARSL